MQHKAISIRPFIGAQNFQESSNFYKDLGFTEKVLFDNMSYFSAGAFGFYLQNAYIKDWIDNSQVFLEVDDVNRYWQELSALRLPDKYKGVRLTPVKTWDWGSECFLHDPSGILWHFGTFKK